MAGLAPLIRVRKHAVEGKQKALAELYRQADALAARRADILAALEAERAAAQGVEALTALARYEAGCAARLAEIDRGAAALEPKISAARQAMAGAFAELKKVEIIAGRRADAARRAANKAQGAELDEAALERHRRRAGAP